MINSKKKWEKFKSIKRGYISLWIITFMYILSLISPLFINNKAIIVFYNDKYYFPIFKYYNASEFELKYEGEPNYRQLKKTFSENNSLNWVLLPLYPYGTDENLLNELNINPPTLPTIQNIMGTDDRGRDVFARLVSGFFISLSFGLIVTFISFSIGTLVGVILGYFGGMIDIFGQRIIEIWQSLPFIYVIMILSSILIPGFFTISILLILFGWIGITYYVRGEVYREKSLDYIVSAKAIGLPNYKILIKHIIPNSLTSVISFIPFAVIGNIAALVSLDFLGLGIPQPTPSWGQMMNQGVNNLSNWWLLVFPLIAEFITLLLIVFIGEALRESYDPKQYSN